MLNTKTLEALVACNRNDKETLNFISEALYAFEDYHRAVFEMEVHAKVFNAETLGREQYQQLLADADKQRTAAHNALLAMLNALNRLAQRQELPPLYDGTISEEQPYRRQAANAVFEWMQLVIQNRR